MHYRNLFSSAALAGFVLSAGFASGQIVIYEGFDYPEGTIIGQSGGIGLDETWQEGSDNSNQWEVLPEGLTFSGLDTVGGSIKRPSAPQGADIFRPINDDAQAALTADNSTIWFSFLTESTRFADAHANGALLFGTGPITGMPDNGNPVQMAGGSAIGFSYRGINTGAGNPNIMQLHAMTINDGTRTQSEDFIGDIEETLYMIVGRIDWAPDGEDDVLRLYNVSDAAAGLPEEPFATISADLDQSEFNTLVIGSRQVETFDEVRFGLTLQDVLTNELPTEETFPLVITPAVAPDTGFDLEWESRSGKLYNLYTSTDLDGPVNTWTLLEEDIEATPPANVTNVPEDGPRRFYAVKEFDAPPPPPIFSEDFEDDDGGFTVATAGAGSAWEHGEPDSQDQGGGFDVTSGNDGSAGAWGVNLTGPYAANTDTALRSPAIDLGGITEGAAAEIEFALAYDIAADAELVVRVIDEAGDTVIGDALLTITGDGSADWEVQGPFQLPDEAIGESVRIEWRFTGPTDSLPFLGVYLDDVVITETEP